MRLIALVLCTLAAVMFVLPALRRPYGRSLGPGAALVKDPVCQTYVVRSRAVRRMLGGETRYFCSVECARRDAPRLG